MTATVEKTEETALPEKHPVDQVPPLARLAALGLQHVLAMYAGAVAVPLIVGGALISQGKLQSSDLPYLISADLFVAGIATLIQSLGFWRFGVRLPLMQGCTFAAVAPMIAIGSQYGITAIYGSVIASRRLHDAAGPGLRQAAPVLPTPGHRHRDLDHRSVADGRSRPAGPVAASASDDFGAPINLAFAPAHAADHPG